MQQIIFDGVRCFHDLQTCPIKPITLLVGENSSGKTTFLALTRIAWDIVNLNLTEDIFNQEPFLLGSYDQIATFRGGRAGRVKSFTIGMEADIKFKLDLDQIEANLFSDTITIKANLIQQGSESRLSEWSFVCGNFSVIAKELAEKSGIEITIINKLAHIKVMEFIGTDWNTLRFSFLNLSLIRDDLRQELNISKPESEMIDMLFAQIFHFGSKRPYAFAPIRTKPKRTYDPLKSIYDPEGSHVPMVLNKILSEKENGSALRQALESFGKASRLFKSIEAKHKGNKDSDPFQLGVKMTGPSFNLVDVGYGVSQVLPIIVDIILNPSDSTFLLQQPEVHLHPQAQAELSSFLASVAKEQNKNFIIETHSDYIIDRIRMDVRDKKYLNPDDVAILYFENQNGNVKIHKLELDEYGNITNAPPTYRQFFLTEERRMLGI
jgi:AAA15 family ATPase/GTPase